MLYKSIHFEYQMKSDGRTIDGYASTFGPPMDFAGDVIDAGAFKKTIKEGGPDSKSRSIKLLWMHFQPLGMPTKLSEDKKGLPFEARISKTALGNDAVELLNDGVVDKMSIGYSIIKEKLDRATGFNHLKEVKLYEISPVLFPANDLTSINGVKSMAEADMEELIEKLAERIDAEKIAAIVAGQFEKTLAGLIIPKQDPEPVIPDEPELEELKVELADLTTKISTLTDTIATLSGEEPPASTPTNEPNDDGLKEFDPALVQSLLNQATELNQTLSV